MDGWVFVVVFFATLIQATFGFGKALIAMPLLLLLVGIEVAAPLVAMISVAISSLILLQDRDSVHYRGYGTLIAASLVGIVIGMVFLSQANERVVMSLLGGLIVLFSVYSLYRPGLWHLKTDRSAPLFGLIAGALSGAYNTAGPPFVVYGALRRWPAEKFRATIQAFFLPTGIAVVIGHGLSGRLTGDVWCYFAYCLPVVGVSVLIGRQLHRKFPAAVFVRYLYMLLIALGIVLIVRGVWPTS